MADLTQLQTAQNVRLVGSNSSTVNDFYVQVDSTGGLMIAGEGTAGTPTGGILTIQGIAGGTAVPTSGSNFPTTVDTNYGTVGASTLRTAAQIGNATGAADFNAGATGAQTLRTSANQGAAGTAATAWFEKITDGTNVATVKAASTAAAATDTAIVVAISPNNTVAVTQSTSPWVTKDQADGTIGSAVPTLGIQIAGKNAAGNLQAPTLNRDGLLNVSTGTDKSVFGPLVVASRVQQLQADFSETLVNNNITQVVTGTGTVSLAAANASISTGTGTTSSAQIATIGTIDYLPGREMYAQYTAAFTTPTSAASTQLTGLYNGTDGLLIGYNGLTFSIATVAGGASTFVSSSSFNIDTLTGAATSLFTRAGVPEAVNFAFKNVYRIRAGWLGAAPIFFEIMSPDGIWVTFHIVRQPNTSVNPSFLEPSLPLTMLVTKTASDATNLKITTTSWDAGVVDVSGQTNTSDAGTIAALNGNVVVNIDSQSTVVADVTGTWTGTIQVQGDVGDGTWNPIYAINTNAVAAQTITANATLIIACAGFTSIRFIGTAWTSGTANVNWVASSGIQAIIAQVVGNIASGSPDTGNPIKVGGVYNSTLPVVSSGSRVDLQLDSSGRLLTSTTITSQLPAASFTNNPTINSGVTVYTVFTASQKLALKQFYAGGTGIGKQELYSYAPSNSVFITGGDFEVAGDVGTTWVWTSVGGTGSAAQSTTEAFTGTHSAAITFSNSAGNNAQGLKQTFGTVQDMSGWRYVTAEFFNTVSTGGAYTRTISIVLTDTGGNTKLFTVSGLSTASPFNASNWIAITGEINNPTTITGSGFDNTQVVSIELLMTDSANKTGTVYWDTVKLSAQLTPIFPIYHQANASFNISIDPVFVMNIGDQVIIAQTNNDSSRKEYFAAANGVSL